MKKTLFTLTGALLISATLSAQTAITLNQSSYNAINVGTDSLLQTTAASSFPSLAAGTNASWDMSTVTDSADIFSLYRVPTTLLSAQFADSVYQVFGPVAYNLNVQESVTSNGVMQYGAYVPKQTFTVSIATVVVDSQVIVYSSPLTVISFPATMSSSWTSTYHYDFDFTITAIPLSYNNAPGIVRSFVTEKDSVTGWGRMRVKNIDGTASGYMDVLQVQSTDMVVDSFFVNGTPANATILGAFGQTQGDTAYSYTQNYFRPMELTALANVDFADAGYSQPYSAQTHTQRLAIPTAVANVNNALNVNVYPNPVTNHTISVDLPSAQNGSWTYDLINMTGQIVATAPLSLGSNNTHTQIGVSATLAPGIYYLRVNKDGKTACIKPLEIN